MKKELAKTYDPNGIEDRIYKNWEEKRYFHAEVDETKKPFTIVIPPPNVTGILHLGHAMDNTMQDILIRWKRMQGYNALWQPGTDHASISTEVKIIHQLKEEGTTKEELGREKFLERAWEWKRQYGGTIIKQLKKLGSSCDWERERFTMDEGCNRAVKEAFVRMYKKGYIYQGSRIVNWCPVCGTSISDAEVEYEEQAGHLWHIKYPLIEEDGSISKEHFIEFATTRPETMLGDTALAVNPEDERYRSYQGRFVWLPFAERKIPIVADEYVDREFGTGVVKITPGHDPNDFEVGKRHHLPEVNILNDDATINENGGRFQGMDRYACRKQIVKELEEMGLLVRTEEYTHNVGTHERCHTTVEPLIKKQWFVKMDELIKPAVKAVQDGTIRLIPKRTESIYFNWTDHIRDWCISRQLWWGHRIPAYTCDSCGEVVVDYEMPKKCEKCGCTHFTQDPDVLDTWFSSALWPFETLGWPDETPELKYFFPTDVLVTGYDILFFWVIRMIFSSYEQMGTYPFHTVLFHGLIRDEQGRKFSKSLGNGIDPLEVIEKYGADALRFTLVTGNTPGNDMRFYYERVEGNRNFANKLWNASKFTLMNLDDYDPRFIPEESQYTLADKWILEGLAQTEEHVSENLDKYELGAAADSIYDFAWNSFCDWYIETAKGRLYGAHNADRQVTQYVLVYILTRIMALLHPFMPFITEHLWQHLPHSGETLARAPWPAADERLRFPEEREQMERIMDAIKAVRNMRAEANVAPNRMCHIRIAVHRDDLKKCIETHEEYFEKLGHVEKIVLLAADGTKPENALAAVVTGMEVYLELKGLIDTAKERERIEKAKAALEKEIARTSSKLNNKGFLAKAPEDVVAKEKEKLAEFEEKMKSFDERLRFLADL